MLLFPHQLNYQPSPRDRYLRALAEENAAREAYAAQLARAQRYDPYSVYNNSYDDDSDAYSPPVYSSRSPYLVDPYQRRAQARAQYLDEEREYLRLKQIEEARQAAIAEKQRERERMAEARRLQYERYLEQQRQAQEARERRSQSPYRSFFDNMFGYPTPPAQPAQKVCPDYNSPSTSSDFSSQPSRPEPSTEEKEQAAVKIQSFVRAALARRRALSALASIRSQFKSLNSSFTFPTTLEFEPEFESPKLIYNATNAPVHAHEDSLMRLLSKLDAVESAGDKKIRAARKSLANEIEAALSTIDSKKEEMWRQQRSVATVEAVQGVSVEDSSMPVDEPAIEEHHSPESAVPEKPAEMDVDTIDSNTSVVTSLSTDAEPAPLIIDSSPAPLVIDSLPAPSHSSPDPSSPTSSTESSPPSTPLAENADPAGPAMIIDHEDDAVPVENDLFPAIDERAWELDVDDSKSADQNGSLEASDVTRKLGGLQPAHSQTESQSKADADLESSYEVL